MKFTEGTWFKRPGVRMTHPVQVQECAISAHELSIFASSVPYEGRGSDLNAPELEIRLSSPCADVIRVQVLHHTGAENRGPHFQITEDPDVPMNIIEIEQSITLTSGNLTASVAKGRPWGIAFHYDGRLLTRSGTGNVAYVSVNGTDTYMREQLDLGVGESVYGLGERFTPFVKNGQVVESWNNDGGTSSEHAYKSIPFYLTNQGYGIFVNHPEHVSFEIASEHVMKAQFSVPGERLEYFIIGGSSLKQVLGNYTRLTGRPPLPPAWSFGLWLSTSFLTKYDEATITHFVDGMLERDIPLRVFHFDCFWMRDRHWCDFIWDKDAFPDPTGMLARLKERGINICLWINPYISQRSLLFAEGMAAGYLLKRPDGDVWQNDEWQPGKAIVDFTNPQAREWYAEKLRILIVMGVDCFKTDFGERIPTDVVYHDGSDPMKMHNYYSLLYNQTVFDVLAQTRGQAEALVFARSATVGSQRLPVHWGGDSTATYASMAESLRGGLSFGLSGFGFWSHDIGGFEQTATPDIYKRWVAFGLLSSHSRLHGSQTYRVPWLFDDEAVDVLRFFTKLKCRLMPYLYAMAQEASHSGIPMMRAMVLEFPQDPSCDFLDRQYMLGDSLLVAPIFNAEGNAHYYLPQGTWTNFLTGETVTGGTWQREQHTYMSLPLYARPGSIIALGDIDYQPDYDFAHQVELHVFDLQDGAQSSTKIYNQRGERELAVTLSRQGKQIQIIAESLGKPWSLILRGITTITAVQDGEFTSHHLGIRVIPSPDKDGIQIIL